MLFNYPKNVFAKIIILFLYLNVAVCLNKDCERRSQFLPKNGWVYCCKAPRTYLPFIMTECEREMSREGFVRSSSPICDFTACLMNKAGIWNEVTQFSPGGARAYGEEWGVVNPHWASVGSEIYSACTQRDLDMYGPSSMCVPLKFQLCIGMELFENCPEANWDSSRACYKIRMFLEECGYPKDGIRI